MKYILLVAFAIGMIASTQTYAQSNSDQNQNPAFQKSFSTEGYYTQQSLPVIVKNNVYPAPVKVTNPEVNAYIMVPPPPAPLPVNNDNFSDHEILFMIILVAIAGIIGFIMGLFTRRGNNGGNNQPGRDGRDGRDLGYSGGNENIFFIFTGSNPNTPPDKDK